MKRYLLLSLICVSAALTLTSCFPRLLISESAFANSADGNAEITLIESIPDRRYDFVLKVGKRELSGIMVERMVGNGMARVVGTTYFGMTLFDMTLTKDSYTMNSCADFLSGKSFASFLAMNLRKSLKL